MDKIAHSNGYSRLNIYLDDPELREKIKIAAAREGVNLSAYCLQAVRRRLAEEGYLPAPEAALGPRAAAGALDGLRRRIGPIGLKARDLIDEGRAR